MMYDNTIDPNYTKINVDSNVDSYTYLSTNSSRDNSPGLGSGESSPASTEANSPNVIPDQSTDYFNVTHEPSSQPGR
jgi:hypothetical protein